eukprot:scaffold18425_cov112-Isochrysis_galbana.AAC.1
MIELSRAQVRLCPEQLAPSPSSSIRGQTKSTHGVHPSEPPSPGRVCAGRAGRRRHHLGHRACRGVPELGRTATGAANAPDHHL